MIHLAQVAFPEADQTVTVWCNHKLTMIYYQTIYLVVTSSFWLYHALDVTTLLYRFSTADRDCVTRLAGTSSEHFDVNHEA